VAQRGAYCSFAHGKTELRHKNRKFADMSVSDIDAPIQQLSGDVRNSAGGGGGQLSAAQRFSHFNRSHKPRPIPPAVAAIRRAAAAAGAGRGQLGDDGGGRGILDRERRYSAPERLIAEERKQEAAAAGRSSRRASEDIDELIKVAAATIASMQRSSHRLTLRAPLLPVLCCPSLLLLAAYDGSARPGLGVHCQQAGNAD
jgi:hypothetical protein